MAGRQRPPWAFITLPIHVFFKNVNTYVRVPSFVHLKAYTTMTKKTTNVHKRTQASHSCEEGNMVMGCCKNLRQELTFSTKPLTLISPLCILFFTLAFEKYCIKI
jgi:hypothetical protein